MNPASPWIPARRIRRLACPLFAVLSFAALLPSPAAEPAPKLPLRIVTPFPFADGSLSGKVSREDIQAMGKRPVKLHTGHTYDFLEIKEQVLTTRTLAEYKEAIRNGGQANTGFAVAASDRFVTGTALWDFLSASVQATRSGFPPDWLEKLSVSILTTYETKDTERKDADAAAGKSLVSYQKSGRIRNLVRKGNSVTFGDAIYDYEVTWLASGDLDHDGAEERLIEVVACARGGNSVFHETLVAKWNARAGVCRPVDSFPKDNVVAH